MDLIYFVLCSYGLTQILVYGSIFDPLRPKDGKLGELFRCPMCLGFWTGAFLFCLNNQTELFTFKYSIVNFMLLGWLGSATSYALSMVFGDHGIKIEHAGENNVSRKYLDQ